MTDPRVDHDKIDRILGTERPVQFSVNEKILYSYDGETQIFHARRYTRSVHNRDEFVGVRVPGDKFVVVQATPMYLEMFAQGLIDLRKLMDDRVGPWYTGGTYRLGWWYPMNHRHLRFLADEVREDEIPEEYLPLPGFYLRELPKGQIEKAIRGIEWEDEILNQETWEPPAARLSLSFPEFRLEKAVVSSLPDLDDIYLGD